MKGGRPVGSKDKNPQIRKGAKKKDAPSEDVNIVFDIIAFFLVPEELIRYLKFMKI